MMRAVRSLGTFCIYMCLLLPYYPGSSPLAQIKRLASPLEFQTQVHVMISSTTVSIFYFNRMKICLQPKLLRKQSTMGFTSTHTS